MLIDEVTITIKAGDGGKGAVAFNKNLMSLGPSGGRGGNGGSVYAEGVSNLSALNQFRNKKNVHAKNGGQGQNQFVDGANGDDLVLQLPVGTVIYNIEQDTKVEILKIGEKILLGKGGFGGKGNFRFRSPTNTSPRDFQGGLPGEQFTLRLELKLIADVGFIGLPNAGKSSLLNELTQANSKVANYPFTTLEPNLGVFYDLILADIPGLIEGASEGKGLGIKFLRHVERTRILFHLISSESDDVTRDYKIIKKELEKHNKELAKKPEYVFLSKSDTVPAPEAKIKLAVLKKINSNAISISVHDTKSLEKVKKILNLIIEAKHEA